MSETFKLVTGKNGINFIRRGNGDSLMMFMWNTKTGEPENDNDITQYIFGLLNNAEQVIREKENAVIGEEKLKMLREDYRSAWEAGDSKHIQKDGNDLIEALEATLAAVKPEDKKRLDRLEYLLEAANAVLKQAKRLTFYNEFSDLARAIISLDYETQHAIGYLGYAPTPMADAQAENAKSIAAQIEAGGYQPRDS